VVESGKSRFDREPIFMISRNIIKLFDKKFAWILIRKAFSSTKPNTSTASKQNWEEFIFENLVDDSNRFEKINSRSVLEHTTRSRVFL